MTINSIKLTINRTTPYDTSYNVYYRAGGLPVEDGDGTLIGNFPVLPWINVTTVTWIPPAHGIYGFSAVPISNDKYGRPNILGGLVTV